MTCLLQPECNFLHGFLRCKLPAAVVDIEVKVTSMQGTHIFRRDRTIQLIKCTPWSMKLCSHPTIVKKMKTFLEEESKLGLIIPVPVNQLKLYSQRLTLMSGKVTLQKRGRELHPKRSLGQPPPGLLGCALPYWKPHQNPTVIHHQQQ